MTVGADVLAHLVARVASAPPRLGARGPAPVRLVCVDGPAGSGKTTLAAQLGAAVPAEVVHMDDLYDGWDGGPGNAAGRLHAWVLDPLDRGEPGRYRRYDWVAGAFAEWHEVPPAPALVVEGCGSMPRSVDAVVAVRVWVEAPDDVRLARGLARDGDGERDHWLRWMADEAGYYARERSRERADVRIDGFGAVVEAASLRSTSRDAAGGRGEP